MDPYKQTTDFTAASSALLMILNHHNKLELNRENEYKLWHKTALLPIRACSIYGLAIAAKEHGLNPRIIIENLDYEYPNYRFKSYTKKELNNAKFSSKIHLEKAKKLEIPIEEREINFDEIKKLLYDNKILLLRLNVGIFRDKKTVSNYVVVYGYGNGKFLINDTRKGKLLVEESAVKEAFETVKSKGKRDHRMIIF